DFYRSGVSQKISYSVNGVYAHIRQGPAPCKIIFGKPSLWPPIFMDTVTFGLYDLPNFARNYIFFYVLGLHIEPPHMAYHDQVSRLCRDLLKPCAFLCIHGHGFLYKNILSVFKKLNGVGHMIYVWSTNDSRIDRAILYH